jgi:hypothetical protein
VATLRATDVTSGSSVVGQFTIAQFINGNSVLSVIPTGTTTFTGPDTAHCSSGASATFYVFGGSPPYTIATNFPQAVSITGNPVLRSGGGFTITTNGVCFTGLTFAITDAAGRTLLTPPTADNVFGTAAPAPAPIVLTPSSLSPLRCDPSDQLGQILATGGTGTYTVAVVPSTGNTPGSGGPLLANANAGSITVSVQPVTATPPGQAATGDWVINVSSGSAVPVAAVVHCP